jgi:hypothetical protein
MSVGGWQSIPASRLNASNADTWRGRKARQQRYCSARCAMRARSERYRQQMAAAEMRLLDCENGGRDLLKFLTFWMGCVASDDVAVSALAQPRHHQWMKAAA